MTTDRNSLASLRHELRTPLNHIIGYTEILLEDIGEKGGRSELAGFVAHLRRLREDAREVLRRINDFLAPAWVEAGGVDLARLPAELSGALDRIVQSGDALRTQAVQAGAEGALPDIGRIATAARHLQALVRQKAAPAFVEGPAVASGTSAAGPSAVPSAGPGRILVVDDDEENREMLARRLTREGHRVQVAPGGGEALDALRRLPIDVILLDVMMPDLDGRAVLQRLKSDPDLREIPVLMISALDDMDSVVRCIELGAEDYLPKPFDPVLLRARIGACLEKKRLRDQEVRHLHELAEWNRTLEQRVEEQVTQMERLGRLKRFFSPQLADLIVAGGAEDPLKTHRREVTVVFLDLRGFTSFAETSEPEEVMGVLREYHGAMGRLILEHEGTIERFAGDGMMVFFNDPIPVTNPAERAVRMAVAMRDRVQELTAAWRKRGHELGLGIGIAQGYATIGAIGFEGRWDYGAIGAVTNLAARLCGEAKDGQILVSSRLAAAIEELIETEALGPLSLKGFSRPIPAFSVLRLK